MKHRLTVSAMAIALGAFYLAGTALAQEKKAEEKKAPAKVAGDIGLLDMEKNYMIVVTKEGKLVTLDFDQKTKVLVNKFSSVKMADVGLGSAAVVEYAEKGDKKVLTKMQFTPAKGE